MKEREHAMSFWEGERCEYCGGPIRELKMDMSRKAKGHFVVIEGVPTGVCAECGTRYYAANVLKSIEEAVRGRRKPKREVRTPVYVF